jgi:hypothetical protein
MIERSTLVTKAMTRDSTRVFVRSSLQDVAYAEDAIA